MALTRGGLPFMPAQISPGIMSSQQIQVALKSKDESMNQKVGIRSKLYLHISMDENETFYYISAIRCLIHRFSLCDITHLFLKQSLKPMVNGRHIGNADPDLFFLLTCSSAMVLKQS